MQKEEKGNVDGICIVNKRRMKNESEGKIDLDFDFQSLELAKLKGRTNTCLVGRKLNYEYC